MDKERLAEILGEMLSHEGVNSFDDLPYYLAAELLKVCEVREKDTDDKE